MKELNIFRQFINESKEKTNEGPGDGGIVDKMMTFAMKVFKLPGMNRVLYNMATDPEARKFLAMSDEDIKMMFDEFNIKLPKNAFKEGKEETNEIFGMGRSKRGEMALDFSAFVEELFDEGVISKELHNKLSRGVAELYSNVMDAEPGKVQKTYDYEPFEDDGLNEETQK